MKLKMLNEDAGDHKDYAPIKDIPEHSSTVLVKNEYYPDGLTEYMVWKHNENHKSDYLRQLKNKRTIITLKTEQGKVYRRKDNRDREYVIKTKDDINNLNSGRAMEFHIVADELTKIAWVDLDPKEQFDFNEVKEVVRDLVPIIEQSLESDDIEIKFSGGRGFHILIYLSEEQDVDQLQIKLKDAIDEYVESNDKLTTRQTDDPAMMRVDVSTLHESGSIRATWSLDSDTGLASVPLDLDGLESFTKEMAVVTLPQTLKQCEFKEDPNSTEGQIRWRLRDPDSYIKNTFETWKYFDDMHEEGITYIVGKLKQPYGDYAIQAIRFSRDVFDEGSAKTWWDTNYWRFDKLWTEKDWAGYKPE